MVKKAEPNLYSQTYTAIDRARIDEANAQNTNDLGSIATSIQNAIRQGLGLYSSQGQQDKFNQVYDNAQNLLNNSRVNPGNVDFSSYQPFIQVGQQAAGQSASLLGLGDNPLTSNQIYQQYLSNPYIQAQLDMGNRNINAQASANGTRNSGAILKALQSYGQGIAGQQLGSVQSQLYNLAGLGATAANQYASNLLNKYTTDQQAALGGIQNQTSLLGQQVNLLNSQNNAQNTQASLLTNLTNTNAQLQAQAANQRQSSLAGSAGTFQQTNGAGWGGAQSSLNTRYQGV